MPGALALEVSLAAGWSPLAWLALGGPIRQTLALKVGSRRPPEGVGTGLTEPGEVQGPLLTRTPSHMPTGWCSPLPPRRSQSGAGPAAGWEGPWPADPAWGVARGWGRGAVGWGDCRQVEAPAPHQAGVQVWGFRAGRAPQSPLPWWTEADTDRSRTAAPGQEALWGERSSRASLRRASALGLPGPVMGGEAPGVALGSQ